MPDSCCCIQKKATLNWVALAFICGGVIRSITRKISLLDARYSPPPWIIRSRPRRGNPRC